MSSLAIEVKDLAKTFKGHLSIGRIHALRGVDLAVPTGVIYGFLGPNGAGKTTTLKVMAGLLKPDRGEAKLLGVPVGEKRARERIGFLPETPYFYDYLTGAELLMFFGRLHGLGKAALAEKVPALLRIVGLEGKGDLPLRKYSKGMLQRVGLAQALINEPELIILDEPMSGLDPIGRREIRDLILSLRAEGKTVFFSSHILADAEMICDEVAILASGRVVSQGSLEKLLSGEVRFWDVSLSGWSAEAPLAIGQVVTRHDGQLLVRVQLEDDVQTLLDAARSAGARILAVTPHKASLEDLFMSQIPGGAK
ncbi:MAG: ABC transporter ATP-binding protein [Acidobacteria bacterium]|nr:ABC transporter ATP-binding protein [Acidobacteriota bacterium]